jgi:hypothetical protein
MLEPSSCVPMAGAERSCAQLLGRPSLFRITPDDIVPHAGWKELRAAIDARLAAGDRLITIIGEAGTGKTLLLADLARALRARGRTVRLLHGRGGHQPGPAEDPADIILVDEADRASDRELAELLGRGGTHILAGLPSLGPRLNALGVGTTVLPLAPLSPEEVPRFLAARLVAAGEPPDLLGPDAVRELTARSGGKPRLLNNLAGAALFGASLDGASQATARHVAEAAALQLDDAPAMPDLAAEGPERVAGTAPDPAQGPVPRADRLEFPPAPVPDPGPEPAPHAMPEPERIIVLGPATALPQAAPDPEPPVPGGAMPNHPAPAAFEDAPRPARPRRTEQAPPVEPAAPSRAPIPWKDAETAVPLRATGPRMERSIRESRPAPIRRWGLLALFLAGLGSAAWIGLRLAADGTGTQTAGPGLEARPRETPIARIEPESRNTEAPPTRAVPPPPPDRPDLAVAIPPPPPPQPSAPPAPPAPPAPAARPDPVARPDQAAAPLRLVLHRPGNSPQARAMADWLVATLSPGFGPVETRTVSSGPGVPTIRYFHAADAASAGRLANALAAGGIAWRVQDLSHFRPLPRQGTVELWLP